MKENHLNDYHKWYKWAYDQEYLLTSGSYKQKSEGTFLSFLAFIPLSLSQLPFLYWNEEKTVGIIERNGKFIGIACLAAKEVTDKESFVRRFGLSFEKMFSGMQFLVCLTIFLGA